MTEQDAQRHQREMQAALKQIKAVQSRTTRKWRLDVPVPRMAVEGIVLFLVAFLVGRGLASLYYVIAG